MTTLNCSDMVNSILKLVRLTDLLFLAIVLWVMEKWVVEPVLLQYYFPTQMPLNLLLWIIGAFVGICAGGYVINAYFDTKIDAVNHGAEEVVIGNAVSKSQAMILYGVCTAVGNACGIVTAVLLGKWAVGVFFVLLTGLLWFYSASYKRQLVVGNLLVAICTTLPILFIAYTNVVLLGHYGDFMEGSSINSLLWWYLGTYAVFAGVLTLAREIIKSCEDVVGDREFECHTLPVVWGETASRIITTTLLVLAMGGIAYITWGVLLPSPFGIRYVLLGLLTPLVGVIVLLWCAKVPSDYRRVQLLLKFAMFMGVLSPYALILP